MNCPSVKNHAGHASDACARGRSVRAEEDDEEGMATKRDDGEVDASADDACALTPSEGARD